MSLVATHCIHNVDRDRSCVLCTEADIRKMEATLRGQAAERAAAWEADRPNRERREKIQELEQALYSLKKVDRDAEEAANVEHERAEAEALRLKYAPFIGATIVEVTETGNWSAGYFLSVVTSAGTLEFQGGCYEGNEEEVKLVIRPKP